MPRNSTEEDSVPEVLYQDEHLVAVRKPPGIPVQADRTDDKDLLQVMQQCLDGDLGLVHRLDRPVSGVVVFARNALALETLNKAFRERLVAKRYLAIVEGAVLSVGEEATLEHVLLHDTKAHRARVRTPAAGDEKVQRLHYRVLAQGERLALMEVRPEGGAFHQIRAQLAAAGAPIRGDVKYGARRSEKDRSIALHALSLRLAHPEDGRVLEIRAEPPRSAVWKVMLSLVQQV